MDQNYLRTIKQNKDNILLCFFGDTAYVDMGGFNVISVDWSSIADDILYPLPALLTVRVGKVIALFLDGLVDVGLVKPADIHLIGHSLGAHVVGACGSYFSKGKIGRITGAYDVPKTLQEAGRSARIYVNV